jgi:hypothetical protein
MAAGGQLVDVGWNYRVGTMGGGGKPPFLFESRRLSRWGDANASVPASGREGAGAKRDLSSLFYIMIS